MWVIINRPFISWGRAPCPEQSGKTVPLRSAKLALAVPTVGMAGAFSVVLAKMIEEQKETVGLNKDGQGDASNIHPHQRGIKNDVPTLTSQEIDKNLAKDGVNRRWLFR